MKEKRVIVHDTGAIISGLPLRLPHYLVINITTTKVIQEILDKDSRENLRKMIDSGILSIEDPPKEWLIKAKRISGKLARRLSSTDLSVLALALMRSARGSEVYVATDDYTLQNAAIRTGLRFIPIRYAGIRESSYNK